MSNETVHKVWAFEIDPGTGNVVGIFNEPWDANDKRFEQDRYVARPLLAIGGDCNLAWYTYVTPQRTPEGGWCWRWRGEPRLRWDGQPLDITITLSQLIALAEQRIRETPVLQPYEGILMYPDWPERAQHLTWIVTAKWEAIWKWADAVETALSMYKYFEQMANGPVFDIAIIDLSDAGITPISFN